MPAFELASRPVTCGEYLEFMAGGGYRQPEHWLSDGWTEVRLTGQGFGATQGSGGVTFGGVAAMSYVSWSDTEILCVTPATAAGDSVAFDAVIREALREQAEEKGFQVPGTEAERDEE